MKTFIKNNNLKSLKDYFIEFKNLSNCKRIWITLDTENKDLNVVNLKISINFFVHLIGIQKLPMFNKVKNEKLIKKIKNEKITFESIDKFIKSLKRKRKDLKEIIRYFKSKITGLKNIKSLELNEIFFSFCNISFNKNILSEIFPSVSSELCIIKKSNNGNEFTLFLCEKMKKYKLQNFCFVKSFIHLNNKNKKDKEKIEKLNQMETYKILTYKKIKK